MDASTIKENLKSFMFAGGVFIYASFYLFQEYKELENKKSIFNEQMQNQKLDISEKKHQIELMQKDLENKSFQIELSLKEKQNLIKEVQQKEVSEFTKEYQNYKTVMDSEVNKKDIKIETLIEKIKFQESTISTLKNENQKLTENIKKFNGVEQIAYKITLFSDKYKGIDKNSYDHTTYLQAVQEYQNIVGLINTYQLNDEYYDFIQMTAKRLYL